MSPGKNNLIAIALVCTSAYFCAATVGALSKFLSSQISIAMILFFQSTTCMLLLLPQLIRKGWKNLKTQKIGLHLARDLAGLLSFFCFFYSLETIPLVDGILLQSTGPLWLPLLAFFWLRFKMKGHLWWGIIIGFIGILLILKPGFVPLSLGLLSALLSGIFSGFTLIAVNKLSDTEPIYRILFYYFLVGSLVAGSFALFQFSMPTWKDAVCLVALGIFTFLAQTFVTYAIRQGKPDILAPIAYSVVIYSGFYDWLIWQKIPDLITFTGVLLVVCGAIFSIYFEKRYRRKSLLLNP